MTFKEWKSLFRFERDIDIPHLSVYCMCPYGFVRVLWHYCPQTFKAWPNHYQTGLVLGWRWPFAKTFRERHWVNKTEAPLAIYGAPMDTIYLMRVAKELGWDAPNALESTVRMFDVRYITPTIRALNSLTTARGCEHNYWIADCPNCARRALSLAIKMTAKQEPLSVPDPHESPIDGFRRREAAAKRLREAPNRELPETTE